MHENEPNNNLPKRLLDALAHLASVKIQDRYIVNGTPESYLLVDDLLNGLDSVLLFFRAERFPERIEKLERQMGATAFNQLLELEEAINQNPTFLETYTFENIKELIHEDPVWGEIRLKAQSIISELNIDLEKWENEYA